jgi:hypothetical protein
VKYPDHVVVESKMNGNRTIGAKKVVVWGYVARNEDINGTSS